MAAQKCNQSCSQCNELPFNAKLLTLHMHFFINLHTNTTKLVHFISAPIVTCAEMSGIALSISIISITFIFISNEVLLCYSSFVMQNFLHLKRFSFIQQNSDLYPDKIYKLYKKLNI